MIADALSQTFSALAHPARRAILAHLCAGEASVQDLAKPFKMSAPAISKHLKVLEQSGLITRSRDAQWRPCQLQAQPIKDAVDWMEQFRKEWDDRFDRLDTHLQELQGNETGKRKP